MIKLEQDKIASLEKKIKEMLHDGQSEWPLVLKCQILDLQNEIFQLKLNISTFENIKKNYENEVSKLNEEKTNCIQQLTKVETKLCTTNWTIQTIRMLMPKPDSTLVLKLGLGCPKPSYLDKVKCIATSLYNSDYMTRDTLKDYMFVPNDISQEEIKKRLKVKQRDIN